jgi:hypothetical protein
MLQDVGLLKKLNIVAQLSTTSPATFEGLSSDLCLTVLATPKTPRPTVNGLSASRHHLPLEKIAAAPKPTIKANQIRNRSASISVLPPDSFTVTWGGH